MASPFALNGWWRLWIVISVLWLAVVAGFGVASWPEQDFASHRVEYINQLPETQRDLLVSDGSSTSETEVEMPNGQVLRFRPGTSQEAMTVVARAYASSARDARSVEKRRLICALGTLAVIPSGMLAVLGLAFAWVRRGFCIHGGPL
jgi:hypothetical protein